MLFKKKTYISWEKFTRLMNNKAHIMFISNTCKESSNNILDLESRGFKDEYWTNLKPKIKESTHKRVWKTHFQPQEVPRGVKMNIYSKKNISWLKENDEISDEEEGFMQGWLEAFEE